MTDARYTWTGFYEELASKLLPFKDDREALIGKLQAAYAAINMKPPKLDSTPRPADIDPYTVFGVFNKGISETNRRSIVASIANEFGVATQPPTDFDGIPVLNNLNATFYAFTGDDRRGDHDIDNLWQVFEASLALARNDTPSTRAAFCKAFDLAVIQFSIGWKLTIGLFWTRPDYFVSFDQRSRWFMGDMALAGSEIAQVAPKEHSAPIHDGKTYLVTCDSIRSQLGTKACPYPHLAALSDAAFKESERVNEEKKAAKKNDDHGGQDNALGDDGVETIRYWLYAPGQGARRWDDFYERGVMGLGWHDLGDLSSYPTKEAMRLRLQETRGDDTSQKNAAHAVWQFAHEVKPGDIVFAKQGRTKILGRGVVTGDYVYDPEGGEYPNLHDVAWTHRGEWTCDEMFAMKTLTDVTDYTDFVKKLSAFFEDDGETDDELGGEPVVEYPPYNKHDFLSEAYMDEDAYDMLVNVLRAKRNVILQGAPGVGKTFVAKRLAYSMMGVKNAERVMMVQFHQSYSYEDFIEGFRPSATGFELAKGAFYTFCKRAADDAENDYFFIIDEINRGNLSKIFGELFMLIENDKRGPKNKLQLLYSRELFYVPANVYLIGMMNTADRSLALLDYALRRRFAFFDLKPGFSSEGFITYRSQLGNASFDKLADCVVALNGEIAADESLGEGFCIGHSYFCGMKPSDAIVPKLTAIVEYELIPLLREYWFDEPAKVRDWSERLRKAIS